MEGGAKSKELKFFNMKKFFLIIFVAVLFFTLFAGRISQAQAADDNYGLEKTANVGFNKNIPNKTDLPTIIGGIVGALLSFIGILFFVLVIYGGYLWMTAQGNEEQVGKATSIVIQASVGLIIVAAAYLITRFLGETIINQVIGKK